MSQAIKESIVSENNLSLRSAKVAQKAEIKSLSQCYQPIKSLKRSISIASGAIALSLSFALPSQAVTISYSGDTTNAPTFNRPETEGFEGGTNPPTSLSSNGTAVPYYSQPFFVDTTGSYDVVGSQNFLGIQFLYQTSFNPATPLVNLLSGNDPFPDEGNSSFYGLNLTANNQYFLVTTGFDNSANSFGTFTNDISGPGNITLGSSPENVPEPASILGTITLAIFGGSLKLKYQPKKLKSSDS
ncbi:PEP-CTERM sorting domain-containing protein [Cylindrospermum stagnale]|nr:PEP-CTERM sorting domain-containing protein [Cylindrospermum stagnale]